MFAIRDLSVLAYAQGFTLWHYKSGALPLTTATADGFFDEAADMLATGDLMMISGEAGGRIVCVAGVEGHVATAPLG